MSSEDTVNVKAITANGLFVIGIKKVDTFKGVVKPSDQTTGKYEIGEILTEAFVNAYRLAAEWCGMKVSEQQGVEWFVDEAPEYARRLDGGSAGGAILIGLVSLFTGRGINPIIIASFSLSQEDSLTHKVADTLFKGTQLNHLLERGGVEVKLLLSIEQENPPLSVDTMFCYSVGQALDYALCTANETTLYEKEFRRSSLRNRSGNPHRDVDLRPLEDYASSVNWDPEQVIRFIWFVNAGERNPDHGETLEYMSSGEDAQTRLLRNGLGEERARIIETLSCFDDPASLETISHTCGSSEEKLKFLLESLVEKGIVETHKVRGKELYEIRRDMWVDVVRKLCEKLNVTDTKEIHARLSKFYYNELHPWGKLHRRTLNRGYEFGFRYESSLTLHSMMQWTYHLNHAGDKYDPSIHMVITWMEAFWWWGEMIKHAFTRRLFDSFAQSKTSRLMDIYSEIKIFENNYPRMFEHRKDRGTPEFKDKWRNTIKSLERIKNLIEIDGEYERLGTEQLQARLHLDVYITEAMAFLNEEYSKDELKNIAENLLDILSCLQKKNFHDYDWYEAWLKYYLEALGVSGHANLREAIEKSAESDNEIRAKVYMEIAEIAWKRRDMEVTKMAIKATFYYSLRFSFEPDPLDEYNLAFCIMKFEEIANIMTELWDSKVYRNNATEIAIDIWKIWNPGWEPADGEILFERWETKDYIMALPLLPSLDDSEAVRSFQKNMERVICDEGVKNNFKELGNEVLKYIDNLKS